MIVMTEMYTRGKIPIPLKYSYIVKLILKNMRVEISVGVIEGDFVCFPVDKPLYGY